MRCAVGLELFAVVVGVEDMVLRSRPRAPQQRRGTAHGVRFRTLGYAACLVIEQTGAAITFAGHT